MITETLQNEKLVSDKNKNESEVGSQDYTIRALGRTEGPKTRFGQQTFCVVLGLFDSTGHQAVHIYPNGEEKPIVFLSVPLLESNIFEDIIH